MADEEFMSEYKLTLSELVTNAKITINVLSMLADENKKFAPQIAEAVEERIRTATPGQKLPALYLIDSIIKNVKDSDYLKIFTKNIVSLFICVFERGDERIRSAMYKLRQTWIELFPNDVLLKLDLAVNSIDPAWPITAVRPVVGQQAVHLNPDFLNKAKEALKGLTSTNSQKGVRQSEMEKLGGDGKEERAVAEVEGSVPVSGGSSAAALGSEAEMLFQKQLMAKQLLAKQQELLQIQQRRVEIELAKAQMQIEQAKQLALQKPKQSQEVSINDAGEDKTPKKSKAKRSRTSSGAEDAEGSKSNEKAPEEPAMTSLLKSKSPVKAAESAKTELGADPRRTLLSAEEPLSVSGVMPEKPQAKKRKSGDAQKVDPRLRKKMMLNKDGASVAVSIAKPPTGAKTAQGTSEKPRVGVEVKAVGTKTENAKVAKEVTLSEDLKDLFGNVDKDFRTQMHSAPKTSLPDTQWKVLKSEGQNVPAYNFAHLKVVGGERRMNVQNRFGPYGKHLGAMHGNRKTLLPTPAPIFGQDLKPRQATVDNFEKLQEMKRELDVEAERLNSLSYDASKNGDFEAFEADVMRGNSLLNKARWNNWRHQERGAKRPRRQAGSEQFHNGPPFGNRPQHRSLLHAPPRVANFSEAQPHRPSPPHPQFPHQPSPPQFNQPRSPGQGNFGHGHNEYRGDDYNFDHFGGDRYNRETHYRDENCRSLAEGSWGGYQPPNPHNPPPRPSNPIDWRKPGPQQAFSQSSINSTTSVTKGSFGSGHHNNFNVQNNDRAPPGNSQTSENYVHQLFSKLTKFGFLNNIVTSNSKDQEKIPRMSDFDVKQMKIKYRSLIEELSSGTLCRTCGLTFPPTKGVERKKGEEQAKARYLMHLDWHFQVNKKANSIPKAERCREYYPDQDTWYRYEVVNVTRIPIEDVDEGDVKKEDAGSSSVAGKSKCIDAAEDKLESMKEKYKADLSTFVYKNMVKENEKCFICHEGFESYWDDEKEEWGLRDAYMLKEKLFHSSCFLEYEEHDLSVVEQQSSTTPSIPNDSIHSEWDAKEDIENKVEASDGKILVECAVLPDVEADAEEAKVGLEESDDAKCIPDLV